MGAPDAATPGSTPRSLKRFRPNRRLSARTTTVPPMPSPLPIPPLVERRSSRFGLRPPGVHSIASPVELDVFGGGQKAKSQPRVAACAARLCAASLEYRLQVALGQPAIGVTLRDSAACSSASQFREEPWRL